MAIPKKMKLERSGTISLNHETGKHETREETDEQLAERQKAYDNFVENFFSIRAQDIQNSANSVLPDTDWTQLLDSNLTDESLAEFTAYRKKLKEISKNLMKEDGVTPKDKKDSIWDPELPLHDYFPKSPTPEYKPEEEEE
tara:strand:- start:9958 stop:10380 length:423 start_codon:yes stop_codon:yes gene_type:complete